MAAVCAGELAPIKQAQSANHEWWLGGFVLEDHRGNTAEGGVVPAIAGLPQLAGVGNASR
jgi:hypothetical protein